MSNLLIDYNFNDLNVSSNSKFPISFNNSTLINGPGNISFGSYPQGINLGTSGKANVNISTLKPNLKQFCIRFAFKVNAKVTSRSNIFESNFFPVAVSARKPEKSGDFDLVMSVRNKEHGWAGCKTSFKKSLKIGKWYTASLVYDLDTVGLFVDNKILSVHAFPNGLIQKSNGKHLFFGTWVDGNRNHFNGAIAGFQWHDGIPTDLEDQLDELRSQPEWNITFKHESIKKKLSFGNTVGAIKRDSKTGNHIQHFDRGAILFHHSIGVAFEMHGAIYTKYKAMAKKESLGYLVSDEMNTTRRGGKKSIFSKGGIYWSSATSAHIVTDEIYLEYENLGESRLFGFPTRSASLIPGGREQLFQFCRMYYKTGSAKAHEVHGSILSKLLSLGGVRKIGFPVTNEMDVKKGTRTIGKYSDFESRTIYWSSTTGSFEVHGDIRKKYKECGGPAGALGFPTSDEKDIPNHSGTGKINSFQKGSICWYGSYSGMVVARPFTLFVGRFTTKENEGITMGQNDLYMYVKVWDGSTLVYNKRFPKSGSYDGRNVKNLNVNIPNVITPNSINKKAKLYVQVWDDDGITDNDKLGTFTRELNASNGWGLRSKNGVHDDAYSKVKSMTWSVKPKVNINLLSQTEKWWAVSNRSTNKITWTQNAQAFRDIDSETEWWDVTDWLQKAFYELVVEDVASGGNCFGMALEGIYARKNSSVFGMPINRFDKWNELKNEFNIKHTYQVGAEAIWWFLGQFVTGNTRDPKDVFLETRREFNRGNDPVICISQNWDFSGGPHCILPVAWDTSSRPWKMTICDPNFPGQLKTLKVDPDRNSFEYRGSRTYKGKEWSGGRFHYMPWSRLCQSPRTPVWDAIMLILSGTILILGDDAQTTSIKDKAGRDLNAFGSRALQSMKSGVRPEEYFVGFQGFDRPGATKPNQIMMRREKENRVISNVSSLVIDQPIHLLMRDRSMRGVSSAISPSVVSSALAGRSVHRVLADANTTTSLSRATLSTLNQIQNLNDKNNFIQHIKGLKNNGKLQYVARHGMTEIRLDSTIGANEANQISVDDLGTQKGLLQLSSPKSKKVDLKVMNKLGVKGDFIEYTMKQVPLQSAKKLEVQMRSGVGGMELLNNGSKTTIPFEVKGVIGGKKIERKFKLPLDKGARIKPADLGGFDEIAVTKIEHVFGNGLVTNLIKKQ